MRRPSAEIATIPTPQSITRHGVARLLASIKGTAGVIASRATAAELLTGFEDGLKDQPITTPAIEAKTIVAATGHMLLFRTESPGTETVLLSVSASSISIRTSAMSCKRRFRSFSRHR